MSVWDSQAQSLVNNKHLPIHPFHHPAFLVFPSPPPPPSHYFPVDLMFAYRSFRTGRDLIKGLGPRDGMMTYSTRHPAFPDKATWSVGTLLQADSKTKTSSFPDLNSLGRLANLSLPPEGTKASTRLTLELKGLQTFITHLTTATLPKDILPMLRGAEWAAVTRDDVADQGALTSIEDGRVLLKQARSTSSPSYYCLPQGGRGGGNGDGRSGSGI